MASRLSKQQIRKQAKSARAAVPDKDERSERIVRQLLERTCFSDAKNVAYYVDVRDEVRTRLTLACEFRPNANAPENQSDISSANSQSRRICVPYCDGDSLSFVQIRSMTELSTGEFGILEPNKPLRDDVNRKISVSDLDVVLVPGVAFDRRGNRIGYGAGYYDRALSNSFGAVRIALAFGCQVVGDIPAEPFDVCVDIICTEDEVIQCQPRREQMQRGIQ